jgi:hypothetical protein
MSFLAKSLETLTAPVSEALDAQSPSRGHLMLTVLRLGDACDEHFEEHSDQMTVFGVTAHQGVGYYPKTVFHSTFRASSRGRGGRYVGHR